jgi:argininosuccinate lyase
MRQVPHTEYAGYRGVGIRLMEPMVSDLRADSADGRELPLFVGLHAFDKAHVLMMGEEGLIPKQDAVGLLNAFREMEALGVEEQRSKQSWGLHSGESYLVRKLGYEVGGRIHLGRSSGDLIQVARRVATRSAILETLAGINALRAALLDTAEATRDAVMPGYTHGMHAQPTTLGAQLLAWVASLERDYERLALAYKHTNQSPAGAAIMTGSPFAVNRERTAECLGFDEVIYSTFDAIIGAYDYILEAFSGAAILAEHTGRFARDISFWFSNESQMVDIPDRFCHTSSIMMHKKNPVALEQISGSTSDAVGGLMAAFLGDKRRSGGSEGDGHSFFAMLDAFSTAKRDMNWLALMTPVMDVKRDRMLELASSHWAIAPDIASALVREKGLPWRIAHQIIGTTVRLAHERGIAPLDATPELIDEAAVEYMGQPIGIDAGILREALDPVVAVSRRTLFGGPAPEQTLARCGDSRNRLKTDQANVAEKRSRIEAGKARLEEGIDRLTGTA